MVFDGIRWYSMVLYGIEFTVWYSMVLDDIGCYSIVFDGIRWYCMILNGI